MRRCIIIDYTAIIEKMRKRGTLIYAPVEKHAGTWPLPPSLLNLSIAVRNHTGSCNPPHNHDYIQLWYVQSGYVNHWISGTNYTQKAHSLAIIPPYTTHYLDTCNTDAHTSVIMNISDDLIRGVSDGDVRDSLFYMLYVNPLTEDKKTPIFYFSDDSALQIDELINDLVERSHAKDRFMEPMLRTQLAALFSIVSEYYTADRGDTVSVYKTVMERTFSYIDSNFSKHISVADVCRVALMSETRFMYVFKRIVGMTLIDYVNYRRVLLARELLRTTQLTVKQISADCGFKNDAYMCRIFKKYVSVSPGEYRRLGE